jgi:predicted Zn finger-like uncharacterized protein
MITFSCPHCASSFAVKDEFAGRKTKCPKCDTRLIVPPRSAGFPTHTQSRPDDDPQDIPTVLPVEDAPPKQRPTTRPPPSDQPARTAAEDLPEVLPVDGGPKKPEGFFGRLLKTKKCEHCSVTLTTMEIAAKLPRCANCTLRESGVLKDPREEIIFSQGASYCDGLPDRTEPAKKPGFIYVAADHIYYRDASMFWSIEWERVRSLDLQNFRIDATRGLLAAFGGGATGVMLQNVKNTLKVTYLDPQDIEWSVAFRIHGALTVPGEQQTAMEVLAHTNRFKPRFAKSPRAEGNSDSGSDTNAAKLNQLAQLKDRGIITIEEFEAKKKEILARM